MKKSNKRTVSDRKTTKSKKIPNTKSAGVTKRKVKPVENIKHKDKRIVIPTQELRGFVKEDEEHPKIMLYPRDPSLDPQLVWKGKDEQDSKDLAVPVVPIYIQEKIHPKAIIENIRARAESEKAEQEPDLFGDFNGIPFDKQVDFYQQEGNWQNRLILGDSLLVMTSLAEKEGLKGKVQMIYMDPPYGINYGSNWQVSTRKRDVRDGKAEDTTRQPEQIRAFRDTWKLGIHSYLAYLRDRLIATRDLLTESGSVFVQIGDENVHLVRCLLDEIMGSENFIGQIRFRKKTMPLGASFIERMGDFIIWYAKNKEIAEHRYRPLLKSQDYSQDFHWNNFELPSGERVKYTKELQNSGYVIPNNSRRYRLVSLWPASFSQDSVYPIKFRGREWLPADGQCWPTNPNNMDRLIKANQIEPEGQYLRKVLFEEGADYAKLTTDWADTIGARDKTYVVETSPTVVERCMLMTTDPGDLVLDPTCGSGTTAFVAEHHGRRWITIDTSRVALTLARARLMSAMFPYYYLVDSQDGILHEAKITGKVPPDYKTENNIKKGFVYKRVSHISLESIANNPEIDTIYANYQPIIDALLAELNRLAKTNWEKWQVPFIPEADWKDKLKEKHTEWLAAHRNRQREIDDSISRHANIELLYDQPYEDKQRIRVSGPFTVESLNPFRMVSTDDRPTSEQEAARDASPQFFQMVLDNLSKAGIQNTRKGERIKFDTLAPFAGVWLQAAGEFTDSENKVRRVAISIGPEFNAVAPQQIREAAKEAVKGAGFDLLVICGYSFDPHVSQEVKDYGKLTVLPVRMNEDLKMADELLKKTGSGNLFMVFGEPDIATETTEDGKLTVEIRGLDVYDPTTGEIRSSSPDEIACWFIDTNYNGESFFVRHAYFTGADEPYERLKRALRANIDEAAWSALYQTKSQPFEKPSTGKFAVKVINHYGDEVLKVFTV